ncbi:hypothetical protein CONPUDRAFT_75648 [Coniophora puteana RWD-64-598 SS2]|uniref:Transmembrane protein n=1 Tax=Coniophora puteana (strain RWD-64-598) TaxID=741705 RepID=A0A5M3MFU9_CONPW|nr:uncharacterized protein CONPUDRAFT_75648 [Coniophora puteana RWD-64-598 SS2]EIW77876.1 hypothetical protein CONPUDRAFT_75648 [Coniophora puteana RWD-64-598 SS2]
MSTNSTIIVDEADSQVQYSGGWTNGGVYPEYDNTTHLTAGVGEYAMFNFTGVWVSVYGTLGGTGLTVIDAGIPQSQYVIDGGEPTNFTAPNVSQTLYHYQYFSSGLLSDGEHSLVVTHMGGYQGGNTPVTPPSSSSSQSSKQTLIAGAVGGVLGAIVLGALVGIFILYRREKAKRRYLQLEVAAYQQKASRALYPAVQQPPSTVEYDDHFSSAPDYQSRVLDSVLILNDQGTPLTIFRLGITTYFTIRCFAMATNLTVIVDDTDSQIQFSGGWSTSGSYPMEFQNSTHYSNSTTDYATLNFTGVSISVYGTIGSFDPNGTPRSQYVIDGGEPVSFTSPLNITDTAYHYQFFSSGPMNYSEHTLVVSNMGGGGLWLDYFEYQVPSTILDLISNSVHSTPTPSTQQSTSSLHPNKATLTGGIIGGVFGAFLLGALVWISILYRREKSTRRYFQLEVAAYHQMSSRELYPVVQEPLHFGNDGNPFESVPDYQTVFGADLDHGDKRYERASGCESVMSQRNPEMLVY